MHSHSDLIAIVNADLSEKLTKVDKKKAAVEASLKVESSPEQIEHARVKASFKKDIWKAVFVLNLFRYAFAVILLNIIIIPQIFPKWTFRAGELHPDIFFISTILMLVSAVAFTIVSTKRLMSFNHMVVSQFALDIILTGFILYSCGSVTSSFVILFFIVVGTGSVVLPRKQALSLASAGFIILFYEHFYSTLTDNSSIDANYPLLGILGVALLLIAYIISYLAQRIRIAELRSFVPGNESIESFLTREEVNALKKALDKTDGNKTEAAKLLGMSFRSFRYKLTKYEID